MALRFCDGCALYSTTASPNDVLRRWDAFSGAYSPTGGRISGGYITCPGANYKILDPTPAQGTWTIGWATRLNSVSGNPQCRMLALGDGATTQASLYWDAANGVLQMYRSDFLGTPIAIGPSYAITLTSLGQWHFFEVKVVISDTVGTIQVNLDGVPIIPATGSLDTKVTANAGANRITFGFAGFNQDMCDIYMLDGTGGINDTFLGDVTVRTLFPNGAGANTAWTPSSGVAHYTLVNEHDMDTTSYVSSATANQLETFLFDDLVGSPSVKGVQLTTRYAKESADASRTFKQSLKSGSTTHLSADVVSSATQYFAFLEQFDKDPDTSAAWLVAAVNALECGIKLIS